MLWLHLHLQCYMDILLTPKSQLVHSNAKARALIAQSRAKEPHCLKVDPYVSPDPKPTYPPFADSICQQPDFSDLNRFQRIRRPPRSEINDSHRKFFLVTRTTISKKKCKQRADSTNDKAKKTKDGNVVAQGGTPNMRSPEPGRT